jgi:hypothetical protein
MSSPSAPVPVSPVPVPTPSVELTPAVIQELLEKHRETLLMSLSAMLKSSAPSAPVSVAPASAPKPVKVKEPRGPSTNPWILFTKRVQTLIRESEKAAEESRKAERPDEPAAAPMAVMVIQQFASHLKTVNPVYDEWKDEAMLEALPGWTPPETSKHSIAKAAKEAATASAAASVASDSVSDAGSVAPAPVAAAEKPKRKWSDEAKAAAAAKRAATKAAKEKEAAAPAPAADAPADAPVVATAPVAEAPAAPVVTAPVVAAPVKKAVVIKPKSAPAPAPAPPAKKFDLSLFEWTHEGKDYYTNDRGDVVTTDFEWVGRFDGKVIDETVPEPTDLSEATLRE